MISESATLDNTQNSLQHLPFSSSESPEVLTEIFNSQKNMVIWRRPQQSELQDLVADMLSHADSIKVEAVLKPDEVISALSAKLGTSPSADELGKEIALLVDMFCCLFDLEHAGLRLKTLEHAMCPRFHTDKVPCRLITTFQGAGTQWLPHQSVDRSKLGLVSRYMSDAESGVYRNTNDIRQLSIGDVALLKGEAWEGNENRGLVHRSPVVQEGEKRLMLTLDFAD